ncbi:hypothetical protein N7491_008715 [Penicillium cf. griseofulvum]|uniref:Uncharacterized protein n=1 Tax=Penicillium cf. griseofulvum TaxID=2972120 RepID=A0A9W9JQM7_9EURO|nr:hypothetical protein N7472_005683 [Penicillium cf. griseofulvum]KAJ5423499.1 hypothetical protein N7491_008715 [Penicillium cf. griseofulvum]KAJ5431233.1 hypothetical protein N7445_008965 [Penicillium cf. griseofulvum]
MSNCCSWNCFNTCHHRRAPARAPPPSGNAPIQLIPVSNPTIPAKNPVIPASQDGPSSGGYQYGQREIWGELRQRWIDNANEPNCTVQALDFEYKKLTYAKNRSERWKTNFNRRGPRPPVLQGDLETCNLPIGVAAYHDAKISKASAVTHPKRGSGTNLHHITTAAGVIILRNVVRYDGPWWSHVALAQYHIHFAQDALRHVYLENVVNPDTRDFIHTIWAKTQPPNSLGFDRSPASVNQVTWAYDTPEYKAILGTELGKGVAAIVLSAFPRGTRRIARVVVWRNIIVQIRFDIEQTVQQ